MLAEKKQDSWSQFLNYIEERCSSAEFNNWLSPIKLLEGNDDHILLEVPNIFVEEYILSNYKRDLCVFLPVKDNGDPSITFVVAEPKKEKSLETQKKVEKTRNDELILKLNSQYTFESFIEGPSNQFVKSAAMGIAKRPGQTYNPLFIHGGVGLGKTHLLHSIGFNLSRRKDFKVQCITTEGFINDLVDNLRNKSIDKMKRYYRSLDVLLVDDIQFLQSRQNFEEEFSNTFEALINQSKQIVITSDKPPGQLKLSERLIARMEWGLVAHLGMPDLETRVAILQHKAEAKGLKLPNRVAFFIAEHIFNNVRQLEGAVNRLTAYCRLMELDVTEEVAEKTLSEMFQYNTQKPVSVDSVLKSVAAMFNVRVSDLKGNSRTKEIALPRQIAMYLAKELINDSLVKIASSFGGKTHSTLLHAWKKVSTLLSSDENLRRRIQMTRRNIES
ncbi:MAG: chromosomal replication initiator protein DnaA [Simkaniaceae bacterium]